MKRTYLLLGLIATTFAQTYSGLPVVTRDGGSFAYVGFNNKLYSFTLPTLSVANTFTADAQVTFTAPATASGRVVVLSDGEAPGTYTVNTATNTFSYLPDAPQPQAQFPYNPNGVTQQTDSQGNVYTYTLDGTQSVITKTTSNGVQSKLSLPKVYNNQGLFSLQNNTLYVAATTFTLRSSVDYDYYAIDTTSFRIVDGPVRLPNTATAGCPVSPRGCGVPVTAHVSVIDGVLVYVYTISNQGQPFKATINSYTKSCGFSTNSFTDVSNPSSAGTGSCGNTSDNSDPDSTCLNGCAGGAKCCSGQCYSTGQYTCYTRTDGSKQLCPSGMSLCGSACYHSNSYSCVEGQLGAHL